MNKEEIKKAKIGLWNIRADCLKIMQCGLSDRQDKEECLKEIDTIDDILKYIKELGQKESILDKVTEECRKQMKEYEDSILEIFPQRILKIIEGEKKYCCNCGVELNSENRVLNNMCNECKYGLDY